MDNDENFNEQMKPYALQYIKSFLKFFLEMSHKDHANMPPAGVVEANELLEMLNDPNAPDSYFIDHYRVVLLEIVKSNTAEGMLMAPLIISMK